MLYSGEPVVLPYNEVSLKVSHPTKRVMDGFLSLWAYHVTGFNDDKHCQPCFLGERELSVDRRMPANPSKPISIKMRGNYFYICGVTDFKVFTHKEYMENNFHFPVKYSPGNSVAKTTYNGYTFIIDDAELVLFSAAFSKKHYYHKGYKYWSCRNFQFGADMFVKNAKVQPTLFDKLPESEIAYPTTGESQTDW